MSNRYQIRYWELLKQLKFKSIYIDEYLISNERIDKVIDGILAIASSGSIGCWAIWNEYNHIWAIIIAASNVIAAVKHLLPYKSRMKPLKTISYEISSLFIDAEKKWHDVAEGLLTERAIHDSYVQFKEKLKDAMHKHSKDVTLPKQRRHIANAEAEAEKYFATYYPN